MMEPQSSNPAVALTINSALAVDQLKIHFGQHTLILFVIPSVISFSTLRYTAPKIYFEYEQLTFCRHAMLKVCGYGTE